MSALDLLQAIEDLMPAVEHARAEAQESGCAVAEVDAAWSSLSAAQTIAEDAVRVRYRPPSHG